MAYYVIGIGGTGAKCVEALIHLCAAGLMPDGDLHVIFVDPDRANGSLGRAQKALTLYRECNQLALGASKLFKNPIIAAQPDVWSPFGDEPRPILKDFFRYANLKTSNEAASHLFDVLYNSDERNTLLDVGFRGHPSIGAAVLAHTLKLGEDEPWKMFRQQIAGDNKLGTGAKIMLVGSIFGGTGASGIPTIARLIHNELKGIGSQNVSIGAVVVLPYFSFTTVASEKLKADSENFLLSTQAALKYYYQQGGGNGKLGIFDAVYLLGDERLSPMSKSSIGGKDQINEPHFMEVYSALACTDFFARNKLEGKDNYFMIARHKADQLTWQDMPYHSGWEKLSRKITHMTRFAFAYLCKYYPMLEDINNNQKGYRAPWHIDFFEREGIDLSKAIKEELAQVREYCRDYLIWLANIQTSAKDMQIELINYSAFSEVIADEKTKSRAVRLLNPSGFKTDQFSNLTLLRPKEDERAINRLWERMCAARVKDKDANGVGKFIHALYRECGGE